MKHCDPSWYIGGNKVSGIPVLMKFPSPDQAFSWGPDHIFYVMLNKSFSFITDNLEK